MPIDSGLRRDRSREDRLHSCQRRPQGFARRPRRRAAR